MRDGTEVIDASSLNFDVCTHRSRGPFSVGLMGDIARSERPRPFAAPRPLLGRPRDRQQILSARPPAARAHPHTYIRTRRASCVLFGGYAVARTCTCLGFVDLFFWEQQNLNLGQDTRAKQSGHTQHGEGNAHRKDASKPRDTTHHRPSASG